MGDPLWHLSLYFYYDLLLGRTGTPPLRGMYYFMWVTLDSGWVLYFCIYSLLIYYHFSCQKKKRINIKWRDCLYIFINFFFFFDKLYIFINLIHFQMEMITFCGSFQGLNSKFLANILWVSKKHVIRKTCFLCGW